MLSSASKAGHHQAAQCGWRWVALSVRPPAMLLSTRQGWAAPGGFSCARFLVWTRGALCSCGSIWTTGGLGLDLGLDLDRARRCSEGGAG